jgi:hypothetical protein
MNLIAALTAIAAAGCGTTCNLAGGFTHPDSEPAIYGGVQRDLKIVDDLVGKNESEAATDPRGILIAVSLGLTEGVLTVVGDTLTLPITVYLQDRRASKAAADQKETHSAELANPPGFSATLGRPSAIVENRASPVPPPISELPVARENRP